ncbi:MAG: MBL fold metallo-hydrolase [Eubacteriales bacterium]
METKIHQLKINFQVTPIIQRYVYVYLIEGQSCWLIDSGVDGAEQIIGDYLHSIGRKLTEIRGIFLTHAHPDHIGSAARIRELTGCKVYASAGECPWIQDIELQFAERPIPNFHTLVNRSVPVDEVLKDGDTVELEEGMTLRAIGTPGHSIDELSYLLPEKHCIFTGDAIPVVGDIPIWVRAEDSRNSLEMLKNLKEADTFYPAWDVTYDRRQALAKIEDAIGLMNDLRQCVDRCKEKAHSSDELVILVCEMMQTPQFLQNPLFRKTVESYR